MPFLRLCIHVIPGSLLESIPGFEIRHTNGQKERVHRMKDLRIEDWTKWQSTTIE